MRMQTANKRSQHSMLSVMARKEVSKEIATTLGPERYVLAQSTVGAEIRLMQF